MNKLTSIPASLILFPEGTRTTDDEGDMGHFKPGLWHLAKKHPAVELVPVKSGGNVETVWSQVKVPAEAL